MFQESVLSATYIYSLQIPGNRLVQTLLIDTKSQVSVMTHETGEADAILPFIARRRIKDVAERPYQTQAPLVLEQPRAQGLWVERFFLLLRIPTARGTRAGTGRELQGCHPPGMKSCQE